MASTGLTATVAAGVVRLYQLCLSGLKPPCCRFQPSCSEYSRQAILAHGLLRGGCLAIGRLLRCHPFYHGAAWDPVPRPRHGESTPQEPRKPMPS